GDDLHVARRAGNCVALDRGPQRLHEQIAGGAEAATDNHALRVEEIAQARGGAPDGGAGVGDHPGATEVAALGELEHLPKVEVGAVAAAQRVDDPLLAGERLEAAAVAAAADQAVLVEDHVPDLARGAVAPAVDVALEVQACADARRDLEVGDLGEAATGPEGDLGERAEIGVVVGEHA